MLIENNGTFEVEDISNLERNEFSIETIGLTMKEMKDMSANLQALMTKYQCADYISQNRFCSCCGKMRIIKDYHSLTFRTLYGILKFKSPRLKYCRCEIKNQKSFSPLAAILKERTSPERLYLETKWASLLSYGMTTKLLEEVLPIHVNMSSLINNVHRVANHFESQLKEERFMYIDGCPREWEKLPRPDDRLTVGIDGGYVHARKGKNRKAGWFEVIVGKSLQDKHPPKRFGFVTQYDTKPKCRLHEMLKNQGLQMNQAITFISDGGDNVRDLQQYLSPQAEYILDWFHVTMRLTVMKQMSKGLKNETREANNKKLDSIKWYLWHGNVYKALQKTEGWLFELDDGNESLFYKKLDEFYEYIKANYYFIPNYADRYHYNEYISTGFVESTVNELITKRMVKKQQMRWTQKGAHLLLQTRIKTLNNELREGFCQWYPSMSSNGELHLAKASL